MAKKMVRFLYAGGVQVERPYTRHMRQPHEAGAPQEKDWDMKTHPSGAPMLRPMHED